MSLDFNDTSIAYARMSDTDLKKAQFLFRLISSPKLVNAGKQLLNGLLRIHFPVDWAIKTNRLSSVCWWRRA
jgi:proline dehydrogenase